MNGQIMKEGIEGGEERGGMACSVVIGMLCKKLNQRMFGNSFRMYNILTCYLLITKARRPHSCPHSPFCFSWLAGPWHEKQRALGT